MFLFVIVSFFEGILTCRVGSDLKAIIGDLEEPQLLKDRVDLL